MPISNTKKAMVIKESNRFFLLLKAFQIHHKTLQKLAVIVFGGKGLRSSSSFGHEVGEVDIWMRSNFSCLWRQGSALGLRLVMETERERSV
jgi:hypothetical protein